MSLSLLRELLLLSPPCDLGRELTWDVTAVEGAGLERDVGIYSSLPVPGAGGAGLAPPHQGRLSLSSHSTLALHSCLAGPCTK